VTNGQNSQVLRSAGKRRNQLDDRVRESANCCTTDSEQTLIGLEFDSEDVAEPQAATQALTCEPTGNTFPCPEPPGVVFRHLRYLFFLNTFALFGRLLPLMVLDGAAQARFPARFHNNSRLHDSHSHFTNAIYTDAHALRHPLSAAFCALRRKKWNVASLRSRPCERRATIVSVYPTDVQFPDEAPLLCLCPRLCESRDARSPLLRSRETPERRGRAT